ncbi:MAG: sigma-70 family RNA polymerase sigma factor [Armatimonadetes bacterium]|nr:sigma-70 family RNA polymerase sigma factor [Armatimonadota bacterium]
MDLDVAVNEAMVASTAIERRCAPDTAIPDEDLRLSFGELTDKYYRRIYNLICYQVGDPDEAADLTQEVFVKAFRAFPAFRGEARVSTWLWRIAINLCKSSYQKRARQEHLFPFSLDAEVSTNEGEVSREAPDWSVCPEHIAEVKELRVQVRRAIRSLPDLYRNAIVLCDLEGCSYQEIADITQASVQAVKSRIHRGRQMLRQKLERYVRG